MTQRERGERCDRDRPFKNNEARGRPRIFDNCLIVRCAGATTRVKCCETRSQQALDAQLTRLWTRIEHSSSLAGRLQVAATERASRRRPTRARRRGQPRSSRDARRTSVRAAELMPRGSGAKEVAIGARNLTESATRRERVAVCALMSESVSPRARDRDARQLHPRASRRMPSIAWQSRHLHEPGNGRGPRSEERGGLLPSARRSLRAGRAADSTVAAEIMLARPAGRRRGRRD